MGLAASPRIFTEFMHFPMWAIKNDRPDLYFMQRDCSKIDIRNFRKQADIHWNPAHNSYKIAMIDIYMDDILGGHPNEDKAWQQWNHSEVVLKRFPLPTKTAKGRPPNQIQIWLGKEYNTKRQWVKLPLSKLKKYTDFIKSILKSDYVTARTLLKAIGKARHMGTIYKPLNAFARGLESYVYGTKITDLDRDIHVSNMLRDDLNFLLFAMNAANKYGVPFSYFVRDVKNEDITLHTDASLTVGIGGIASTGYFVQNKWSDIRLHSPSTKDIIWRELVAIFVMLFALNEETSTCLVDKTIKVYTDNVACKYMLINMRAKLYRPDLQILINNICKLCIDNRILLWMEHIPGSDNIVADALSRYFANPFKTTPNISKIRLDAAKWLQLASNLTKDCKIKSKFLKFDDDDQ